MNEAKAVASMEKYIVWIANRFPESSEEMAQEARLAAVLAFRSWNPKTASLLTHLKRNIWWGVLMASRKDRRWRKNNPPPPAASKFLANGCNPEEAVAALEEFYQMPHAEQRRVLKVFGVQKAA